MSKHTYTHDIDLLCSAWEYCEAEVGCEICNGDISYTSTVAIPEALVERIKADGAPELAAKVASNQKVFDKIFQKFNRLDAFNPEDILLSIDEYVSEHISTSKEMYAAASMLTELGYKRCDSIECNCGSYHKAKP